MEVIAIIENDNSDKSICIHPWQISITKLDDYYMAATKCVLSDQPVVCEISKDQAAQLMEKGVECIDWKN